MDFSTARNVRIKKSMFNIAHRDIINNYHAQDTHSCVHSVMKDHINTDAFHDSGARRDPSRCYPGTRETALEIISSWVQDPAAHYFWLYGPAGTGKSAIAQTFAEWCEQEKTLGATYFFTRGSTSGPPRGVPPLFSTLAYQLMSKFPGLDDYLWAAVDADRTIFERSLSAQFDKLIVQPFLKLAYKSAVAVVIIDGLDECDGDSIQEEIVRLILGLEQHSLPLLFLISSRPEPAIRRSFKLSSSSLTHFPLDKALDPDDDIHYYLVNEFERIYQESLEMGMPPVSQLPWPSARDIGKLVDKSSGHFIYAATVVRFVQEDHSHPMDRLDAILGIPGKSTNALATQNIFAHSAAFQDLDRLYLHILHRGRGRVELSKILRAIMDFAPYDAWPGNIETIFDLTPGSVPIMLAGLHSIIDVPVDDQPLPFLHASFKDFLADPKRSTQEFYLETSRFNADLACQYMRLIVEFSPSKSGHALTMAIAGLRDCLRATANLLVDTLRKFTNIIIQAPKSIPPCLLYVILDFLLQDVLKEFSEAEALRKHCEMVLEKLKPRLIELSDSMSTIMRVLNTGDHLFEWSVNILGDSLRIIGRLIGVPSRIFQHTILNLDDIPDKSTPMYWSRPLIQIYKGLHRWFLARYPPKPMDLQRRKWVAAHQYTWAWAWDTFVQVPNESYNPYSDTDDPDMDSIYNSFAREVDWCYICLRTLVLGFDQPLNLVPPLTQQLLERASEFLDNICLSDWRWSGKEEFHAMSEIIEEIDFTSVLQALPDLTAVFCPRVYYLHKGLDSLYYRLQADGFADPPLHESERCIPHYQEFLETIYSRLLQDPSTSHTVSLFYAMFHKSPPLRTIALLLGVEPAVLYSSAAMQCIFGIRRESKVLKVSLSLGVLLKMGRVKLQPSRNGDIDDYMRGAHEYLAICCAECLELCADPGDEDDSCGWYARKYWSNHLRRAKPSERLFDILREVKIHRCDIELVIQWLEENPDAPEDIRIRWHAAWVDHNIGYGSALDKKEEVRCSLDEAFQIRLEIRAETHMETKDRVWPTFY